MKHRDYDTMYDENTGNTETHLAVDTRMKKTIDRTRRDEQTAFEEGFASASGVRPETAESGGRIRHPESKDASNPDPVPAKLEEENAGLADS